MSKEEQILDKLSKMPPMVIATAYLYAINFTLYGVDVTKEWLTATQNASALERAYSKGYYEGSSMKGEESNIPFLIHKEMDIPLSECKKAYDIAIDYLRSQANVKG